VVARRRSHLCVALPSGVYDVAGVTVLGLSVRDKDPLPDRRPALVGRFPHDAARVDRGLLALSAAVISRARLMAYARRQTFGLLHSRLLDEGLHLAAQVACLGH
jgi:hypothetical protein